jgi:hypothetical protein
MSLRSKTERIRMLQCNEFFVRLLTAGVHDSSRDIPACPVIIGARNNPALNTLRLNYNNK